MPSDPFPEGAAAQVEEVKIEEPKAADQNLVAEESEPAIPAVKHKFEKPVFKTPAPEMPDMGAFLSQPNGATRFGSWKVIAAVALIVGTIAVPWGWYARSKAARLANAAPAAPAQSSVPVIQPATTDETLAEPVASESVVPSTSSDPVDLAAKRQREARAKERAAKAQDFAAALTPAQPTPSAVNPGVARTQSTPFAGSKKATVQVTYDENGRVTQASGGDAMALRIARQKRFPAGKAGSATVTIPIN
jgi:hypothetical protein